MLSHELRNPLAAIHNAVQLLAVYQRDPEQIERTREMIDRQLHQLVRLVDDLLERSSASMRRLAKGVRNSCVNAERKRVHCSGVCKYARSRSFIKVFILTVRE